MKILHYQLAIILVLGGFALKGGLKGTTDSNSLMIKTQDTLSQSSGSTAAFNSIQGVYGEISGRLYLATIYPLSSGSGTPQVISRIKFNGLSSPTVDWIKYFTSLNSKNLMNLGVTHNENNVFSLQYTGSDGIFLKIDSSNGYLSKSFKITGDVFVDASVYNRLVTDSSDSFLYFRSATANKIYSFNIATDTFQTLTLGVGNIYTYMPIDSGYSILFGAHVASTCSFNFGKTYYDSLNSLYTVSLRTLTFAEAGANAITGTFAKDSSEDSAYLMVTKNPNTLFFSIKPSDLSLTSSVYTFPLLGCQYIMQVRKAGSRIFMVCKYYSDYLFSSFNTSTSKFSSIYITKRTVFDIDYSKIASSISLIATQSSSIVPEIYSYSLDYAFSDTSIFTYSAVEWTTADSSLYLLSSGSTITYSVGNPTYSLYTGNLASNSDITLSSSAYGYFQGYFTNTNVQKYTLSIDNSGTYDPNLSCLSNSATTVAYSLQSYNGGSVPSFVKINASTGVLTISAPSYGSSSTFYLRETYTGDYSMTIDHIVTVEVQDPTPACLGLRIENTVGCVFAWIVIIYLSFFILAGIIFTINYCTWIKSHVTKLRIEKEIRNLPPAGDEDEENGENEVQHSHS